MTEKPILFSGPMVRAILAGRKTQTRRVVKLPESIGPEFGAAIWEIAKTPQYAKPDEAAFIDMARPTDSYPWLVKCPYGGPGDRMWVKETHWRFGKWVRNGKTATGRQKWRFHPCNGSDQVRFTPQAKLPREQLGYHKRPSIFMPREDSRITLEIVSVGVEWLQEISKEDAIAEGIGLADVDGVVWYSRYDGSPFAETDPRVSYRTLWDSINAKRGYGWGKNPPVWRIEFKRVQEAQ